VTIGEILLATDFSPASSAALLVAARLARIFSARVVVIYVFEYSRRPHLMKVDWMIEGIRADLQDRMKETLAELRKLGVEAQERWVEDGAAALDIPRLVGSSTDSMLVLGTHAAAGVDRFVLGSTAEEILRNIACPVVTVGPHVAHGADAEPDLRRILYATDFTESSLGALKFAALFSQSKDAVLRVLHVADRSGENAPAEPERFAAIRADLEALDSLWKDRPVEYLTVLGRSVSQAITKEAERYGADLIVLGIRRAPAYATRLRTSIAFQVIAAAPCAVLTVSA